MMNFVLEMMNFVLKMMTFVLKLLAQAAAAVSTGRKMTDFHLNFALKNDEFELQMVNFNFK